MLCFQNKTHLACQPNPAPVDPAGRKSFWVLPVSTGPIPIATDCVTHRCTDHPPETVHLILPTSYSSMEGKDVVSCSCFLRFGLQACHRRNYTSICATRQWRSGYAGMNSSIAIGGVIAKAKASIDGPWQEEGFCVLAGVASPG
jgi:hypothetical protein